MKELPENTLNRLIIYLKVLENLEKKRLDSVSSEDLARLSGVNSAQLRKDLSFVGTLGTKGVGYSVKALKYNLKKFLGRTEEWNVIIGGLTPFSRYLIEHAQLQKEGFFIMAAFDTKPENIGVVIGGVSVYNLDQLSYVCKAIKVDIGIIGTDEEQETYFSAFVQHGIKAILNLSNYPLFPEDEKIKVENLSVVHGLTKLSYYLKNFGS
ncbi:MAG: redox-sensing transcriptional repressor Rex [Thermodesulfobacterium sp.]|jgi:redox-sensing transcriptional repressor|nr:redox-sensing transcriptional repressor Rex [Thermodesulfobacterium sp.]